MEGAASNMEATNEAMAALFFWMSILVMERSEKRVKSEVVGREVDEERGVRI